jgi:diadenosine tetraphosphate (Ap4A) HIT family hydrolase
MSQFEKLFLTIPVGGWLCSNNSVFVIFDEFSVSPRHFLVITRRIVQMWFYATDREHVPLMSFAKKS